MSVVTPGEKHLTASVFLVTKELPRKVLLLHHKKLNSWLQIGGHVEQMENPIEALVRETQEETGIDIQFLLQEVKQLGSVAREIPVPKFFLEESFPARGNQPAHFHLDLFYVVEVVYQELRFNEKESHDLRWFTFAEALELSLLDNTRFLLQRLQKQYS